MVHSYNEYNTDRCCKESASKHESRSKQYRVITNKMQIGLITKSHTRNKQASKQSIKQASKQQEASSEDGSFNQSKVIELLALLQGQSEGEWLCCMYLPGCSHLRIVSFHMSCFERAAAASGGLFVF